MKKHYCRIFLGPEIGEKQEAIQELEKQFAGSGAASPFERSVYYAGETPVSQMVAEIQNGSLFAEKRFVIIKSAELIQKKDDFELLSSCMANLEDSTALVLVSDETKISKTLESAVSQDCRRIFYELLEGRKQKWVEDFFRREGRRIGQEGIETILEMTENNTSALKQECSRLCLFIDKGKEITQADIEKWLSHTREESAFTLFSRIASGDFPRSLESLRSLSGAKETPPTILAGLAWCFRKLRDYLMLEEAGVRDDFEYRKIGVISPQAKRDYAAAAKRYNSEKVENCLALTAEYDVMARQASSFPEEILMDEYLYKLKSIARNI
ncbi:MAG: DNA polymerase III subunit delta [Treponema sp.]|jgi:DNA polymerase-3 subunit delta|nr:DNA polymerase III subunit delta [Treponema sp.]